MIDFSTAFGKRAKDRPEREPVAWLVTAGSDGTPPADENPAYLAKYADAILRIGMTNESFAASYSTPIRFRPTRLRGF